MNRSNVNNLEFRLVEQAARGDRDARRELFERHREAAYRAAFRVTGRREDALDVVQDAFIKAFDRLSDFQHGSSFKTWLLRIATNRALDLLRGRKVRLAISIDGGGEDDRGPVLPASGDDVRVGRAIEQKELADRLNSAVETLPADQRAVFALYATGDMTYGQIAEALGVPIGTVMSRLYHARKKLHGMLADLAPSGTAVEKE